MSKRTLAACLRTELPRIDAALAANLTPMPASARQVAEHILQAGGKRLRPLLTVLIARLLGYDKDDVYPLAATMEMMHAATLLHDDVMDNAASRRGKTAAHRVFGTTAAILGGDALLARASRVVAQYGDPRFVACLAETLEVTAAGQILELDRLSGRVQNLDLYCDIIRGKTAWMIRASCELGALRADAPEALIACAAEYGLQMGLAFQIVDDALDFAPSERTGKPEGGDLREGKLTPPLYLYLESLPEDERQDFFTRFAGGALAEDESAAIAARVRAGGFDVAARNMADTYLDAARNALAQLCAARPGRGREQELLQAVIRYVRDREM